MHEPVLLNEAIKALAIDPQGAYLDGTFGRGGHSRAILERLGPEGRLMALDRDPQAEPAAQEIRDARFSFVRAPFSALSQTLGSQMLRGMLFDLGVSSPQLDDPSRGFSFRADGPLDMRMDPTQGESAAQWLARAEEQQIREAIRDYGEERFAKQIAAAIVATRRSEPLLRTRPLAGLGANAGPARRPGPEPATPTVQAPRVDRNPG